MENLFCPLGGLYWINNKRASRFPTMIEQGYTTFPFWDGSLTEWNKRQWILLGICLSFCAPSRSSDIFWYTRKYYTCLTQRQKYGTPREKWTHNVLPASLYNHHTTEGAYMHMYWCIIYIYRYMIIIITIINKYILYIYLIHGKYCSAT